MMSSNESPSVADPSCRLIASSASVKSGGYVISEQPYETPKTLADLWAAWTPLGLKLLRLEYREEKSDWGQPSFARTLFRKA